MHISIYKYLPLIIDFKDFYQLSIKEKMKVTRDEKERKKRKFFPRIIKCGIDFNHELEQKKKQRWDCKKCKCPKAHLKYMCWLCYLKSKEKQEIWMNESNLKIHMDECKEFKIYYKKDDLYCPTVERYTDILWKLYFK